MKIFAYILVATFMYGGATVVSGQPGGGGNLPCEPPNPTGCMDLEYLGRDFDVIIDEYVSEVVISEAFGPWIWEDACLCGVAYCDDRIPCEPAS